MGLFDIFDHRARDLQRAASEQGLQSAGTDPFGCTRAPFMLLHRGVSRSVKSVLWRNDDTHAVRVFDYRFFSDVGQETVPSPLFTCATALANAAWPYLSITPRPGKLGFTLRIDEHHEFDVLDPAFSEAFRVRTSDDKFATALLDAEMRYFLLDHARALDVAFNGAWLFISAEQIPADLVPKLFGFVDDLLDHIPGVVDALYPSPLEGDLHVPMPDPGLLVKSRHTQSDDLLDAFERRESTSADRLVSTVLGFNREIPGFGASPLGQEAAELAIDQDILDEQSWTEVPSPIRALGHPMEPDSGFDLDGNPIVPHESDPWGDGRPLPHHGSDKI